MTIRNAVQTIVEALAPPDSDASPRAVKTWRFVIAGSVLMMTAIMSFHVVATKGLVPGVSGYAEAREVEQVQHTLERFVKSSIDKVLLEYRRQHCRAIRDNNEQAKRFYFYRLRQEEARYLELTGREWNRPACAEI